VKLKFSFLILCALGAFLLVHAGDAPSPSKKLNAAGRIEYVDYPESASLNQIVIVTKQVVVDYQCIPAPGNPPSGNIRVYCDSGTGLFTCRTSSGASCAGSATTAFSAISSGTNSTAAMHVGTGATLDATGSGSITATTITGSLDTVTDGLDFVKTPFSPGPIPLIYNGNFEQAGFGGSSAMPPPGWFPDSQVTASYETVAPCEGSHSLKVVYPGDAPGNEVSDYFFTPAQPGDVFYLSGIVKTDGVLTGTLRIVFLDKTNTGIGVDPAATTTSTSCTPISVTGTAPAGTVYVTMKLSYTPNATPGTVWYDAINLYKVNVPAGQAIYAGATSGSAIIGAAAIAGTPNRINLPTTTGTSGQVLTTNGANPQQASWATPTLPATTATNCSSSASPAVCGSAQAGSVVIAAGATTVTVNTTAVTANSQILVFPDETLGTKLSVTCNSTLATAASGLAITARTAATSFQISTVATIAVNPVCLSYLIIN
jgi:hypothetical protein